MAKHARLSPSKADLWMVCPGGIPFAEKLAEELKIPREATSGPAAALGTIAHAYSESLILSQLHPDESVREKERRDAEESKLKLDATLIKNAEMYASWATGFVTTHPNIPWGVELSAPLWYETESKGTADFWAVDEDTLIVVDYKSGRIKVDVVGNLQIAIYLIAIYDEIKAFNPQIKKFRAGVHQPFSLPPGKRDPFWWDFDMAELDLLRATLSAGAREVWEPIANQHRLVVSEKGCRFCPAKPVCPAQNEVVNRWAGLLGEEPEALDASTISSIFRDLPRLKSFFKSVEDYMQDQTDDMLLVNGFERKEGSKKRTWKGDDGEIAQNLENIGVEPYDQVLKSPAKVDKELGSDDLISTFVNVDHNKPRIVSTTKAEKTFKVSTTEKE